MSTSTIQGGSSAVTAGGMTNTVRQGTVGELDPQVLFRMKLVQLLFDEHKARTVILLEVVD